MPFLFLFYLNQAALFYYLDKTFYFKFVFISEKMRKEIEFLQGSFASYKTTVHLDQDEKWKKREHDMTMLMEENKQTAMHELSKNTLILQL